MHHIMRFNTMKTTQCTTPCALRGDQLHPEDRAHVLAAYIYRGTIENQKANPEAVRQAGSSLPLITDRLWLAVTEFTTRNGRLDTRQQYCTTHHEEVPEHKAILDKQNPPHPSLETRLTPKAVRVPKLLKLFIWTEFCTDYTSGLAFAIAADEEEARRMIVKVHGWCPSHSDWGKLEVRPLTRRVARSVSGGG